MYIFKTNEYFNLFYTKALPCSHYISLQQITLPKKEKSIHFLRVHNSCLWILKIAKTHNVIAAQILSHFQSRASCSSYARFTPLFQSGADPVFLDVTPHPLVTQIHVDPLGVLQSCLWKGKSCFFPAIVQQKFYDMLWIQPRLSQHECSSSSLDCPSCLL